MGIRAKLFLSIGLLILFISILMFSLPQLFLKKDIFDSAARVHQFIEAEHQEVLDDHESLLDVTLKDMKADVDSLLFLTETSDWIPPQFFTKGKEKYSLYELAARLVTYNHDIHFVQIHDLDTKQVLGLITYDPPIYSVNHIPLSEDLSIFVLHLANAKTKARPYLGVRLKSAVKEEHIFYGLVPLGTAEMEKIETTTPQLHELLAKAIDNRPAVELKFQNADEKWAEEMEAVRELAAQMKNGIKVFDKGLTIPVGIVKMGANEQTFALLTQDLFRTTSLFDDGLYFHAHPPSSADTTVADGYTLILDPQSQGVFMGNTLHLDHTYITLGGAMAFVAHRLAVGSNRIVLYAVDGGYWKGYRADGREVGPIAGSALNAQKNLSQTHSTMDFEGTNYYFTRLDLYEFPGIHFYVLKAQEHEKMIIETLIDLSAKLVKKISLQMLLMTILSLSIALLILERISKSISKPLVQIAKATETVSRGCYDEVVLPKMGKRKDEIAKLTYGFGEMVKGLQDREKIRGVLDKVVSKDIADEILKSSIHLGGEDRVITMLFSDIRGFTKLTENMTPQKTIEMLNQYITKMWHLIENEGGIIDKYVGDEIMALYGAPNTYPDHAMRALRAAQNMIKTLDSWNVERKAQGEPVIEIGIGVHTGLVVVGNMGTEHRLNYTVLGANVNLASRLCKAAAPQQIIVSRATTEQPQVKESFAFNALPPVSLKGFSEPIPIFEMKNNG